MKLLTPRKVPRRHPKPGYVAAPCAKGKHYDCFTLRCSCPCHGVGVKGA